MIKNLAVVGFDDLAIGIIDQHIRAAHVGPVGACRRCGQVTQVPLLNGVFFGEVQGGTLSPGLKWVKSAIKPLSSYLSMPLGAAMAAGAAQTVLVTSSSAPSNILFFIPILSTHSGRQQRSCIIPGLQDI